MCLTDCVWVGVGEDDVCLFCFIFYWIVDILVEKEYGK